MKTRLLTDTLTAARLLREGKLVAFPTETVFGLGADATNESAIENLFRAKGRPSDNPLIVHLATVQQWPTAARQMTRSASILLDAFSPGPLTVVLPKHPAISPLVTAGLDTVAIRIPSCEATRSLLAAANIPIAAPSANRSGKPSCTRWQSVLEDLEDRIDAILCVETSGVGLESTVVDCCDGSPVLLRQGAISLDDLREKIPETKVLDESTMESPGNTSRDRAINSPGLRHPHYRPNAQLQLWESFADIPSEQWTKLGTVAYCGLEDHASRSSFLLYNRFETLESYAASFYEFLREADRSGAATIWAQLAPARAIGIALRDRQLRAAGTFH